MNRILRLLRIYPAKLVARDRAILESRKIFYAFEGSFQNWELPAGMSYAGKRLREGPKEFGSACEKEFQHLVAIQTQRFKNRGDGRRLDYQRIRGADEPDLWIKLRIKGSGIRGGPYRSRQGRAGYAMTGARVSGVVSLTPPGHAAYSKRFSGAVSPPNSIPDYVAWGGPPFVKALTAANVEGLLQRMLSRFFDGP